jgi:hypothetical protein
LIFQKKERNSFDLTGFTFVFVFALHTFAASKKDKHG